MKLTIVTVKQFREFKWSLKLWSDEHERYLSRDCEKNWKKTFCKLKLESKAQLFQGSEESCW